MCTPFCRKCTPLDLLLKSVVGENEKGSAATVSGVPQSLISLKSIEKALQIKDFIKRNWTPTKIRIVSKSVSSYGGVGETRTLAPGFSRPTPLAGAPRHQLEYYSELLYVL